MLNKILTALNGRLKVTNLFGGAVGDKDTIDGLPIGTADATATGELGVKVIIIAGGSGGGGGAVGGATAAKQDLQIAQETAIAASASVLDDWDETDRAKVNVIAGQAGITAGAGAVAANTPRVTHASDDPLVTLATSIKSGTDKLVASPATEAKQDAQITLETAINAKLGASLTVADSNSLLVNTATLVSSAAYEASKILKASAGKLISVSGYNSGATQFIQLFNSATLPANGVAPAKVIAVPTGSNFSIDVPLTGIPFTAGIVICNSSTGPTKTIGAADCYFTAVIL